MTNHHPTQDAVDADKAKIDQQIRDALEIAPLEAILAEMSKRMGKVLFIYQKPDMNNPSANYYNVIHNGLDPVARLGMIAFASRFCERQLDRWLDLAANNDSQ